MVADELNIDVEASKKRSLANGLTEAEFDKAIELKTLSYKADKNAHDTMKPLWDRGLAFVYKKGGGIDVEQSRQKSLSNGITEAEFDKVIELESINDKARKIATEFTHSLFYDKGLSFVYKDYSFMYDEYNDYLHDR
ncbi:MAG: hypothetical protein LBL41_04315 [Bifidobacteriaceae bacterium]|jgi:hypothetical protein|nr:hypothetical protein [Bifidobacteriaceae bacterium]